MVLDMGGSLHHAIIATLERFDGTIITYVRGGSAELVRSRPAPLSQIGAAEAVSGGGGNIDSSMKRKINSYLKAKIRSYSGSCLSVPG